MADLETVAGALERAIPAAFKRAEYARPAPGSAVPAIGGDTCPCFKGPDGYGREAYHLRRYTERDVAREVEKALAELPPDLTQFDREVVAGKARAMFSRYLGMPVAYERCPYYHELQQRIIDARKARLGIKDADDVIGNDL